MTLSHDQIIARIQCFYEQLQRQDRLYEEISDCQIELKASEAYEMCSYELSKILSCYEDLFEDIIVQAE